MTSTTTTLTCATVGCENTATSVSLFDGGAARSCASCHPAFALDRVSLHDWTHGDDELEPLRDFYEQCRPEDFALVEAAIGGDGVDVTICDTTSHGATSYEQAVAPLLALWERDREQVLASGDAVEQVERLNGLLAEVAEEFGQEKTHQIVPPRSQPRQLLSGGSILDLADTVGAVWGDDPRVAWAEGERLMICAPQGAGKTTLAQRLALARCGIGDGKVLGMPVVDDGRKVLYIAADRPAQALRSLRRMVKGADRQRLDERLIVWKGGLPDDVVKNPDSLRAFVVELGESVGGEIGTVVIDSLKDMAPGLADDKVGSAVDHALRRLSEVGVEVLVLHHPRKAVQQGNDHSGGKLSNNGGRLRTLDDCYGSTWLTSGCGSVITLNGKPGASVVELSTLKPVVDDVGPFDVVFDHQAGTMRARGDEVTLDVLVRASNDGATAKQVATALGFADGRAGVEKARRDLDRLVEAGQADREDGGRGFAAKWFANTRTRVPSDTRTHVPTKSRDPLQSQTVTPRDPSRADHAQHNFGSTADHAGVTHDVALPSPLQGERGVHREPVNVDDESTDTHRHDDDRVFDELDELRRQRDADSTDTDDDEQIGGAS